MIRLSLIGVRVEVPTNQPIVLLREEEGTRFLPIFIGSPEATAIVYALQGLATPRPLTHDLRYRGLVLEDEFVLGYGLHARDLYRNLPFIAVGDREVVSETPDAYVAQLYAEEGRQGAGSRVNSGRTEAS